MLHSSSIPILPILSSSVIKVDDGLPLRKAALTCTETLLDSLPGSVDVTAFLPRLVAIMSDKDELKMQGHQVLYCPCEGVYVLYVLLQ